LVLDLSYAPVAGATVSVAAGNRTTTDENGEFWIAGPFPSEILVTASSEGLVAASKSVQLPSLGAATQLTFILEPAARPGYYSTLEFKGVIACTVIAQAEHTHGSGEPRDDYVECPAATNVLEFAYRPESDPDDLLVEVFWTANDEFSAQMTVVAYDDQGNFINFIEGTSPLRLDLGVGSVQDAFRGGRSGFINVLPGIPENAPGDAYVGVHVDQKFTVYATSFHGMKGPIHWTIDD
jgi:hypothetical protein